MRESEVEKIFVRKVEKELECRAIKLVSLGVAGIPDRLVLAPGGRALFVELKQAGKGLRPLQRKRIKNLRSLGFFADLIAGPDEIDPVIARMKKYVEGKS